MVAVSNSLYRVALAILAAISLSSAPAAAGNWYRDTTGDVVGSPPETTAQLLEYCVTSPAHCAISVNHLSGGWERHLSADRLNPVASTYKLLTLLTYAEAVSDGRISRKRPVPREQWARFWIGADGDELQPSLAGSMTDASGRAYQIRRARGRRLTGALRRSWEHLGRPLRVTVDELAEAMIRHSDNAAADWFLHELGERAFVNVVERHVNGHHDTPTSVNAMFLAFLLNPDQPGLPASGDRVLDAYSGYESRGYRDELARWFARLENPRFVARARACQPAVLPWERRIGACPPSVHEPSEDRIRRLFNEYSMQSNTRTQTRLMTALLDRTLLAPAAREVVEHALEFRLDPRRFRDPKYRNRFRRHGVKSGSFQTKRGLTVLAWTGYFESQPHADGSVDKGAVSIHLRDLPGRAGADIDFDLPLRFAEDVILDTDGFASMVRERLPREVARPELIARARRLEAATDRSAGVRRLTAEVRVGNIGTAPTRAATDVALFLRPGADDDIDPIGETPAQSLPVPPLAPGESAGVLFDVAVPQAAQYAYLVVDRLDVVLESTETGGAAPGSDVQWERLRFPVVNHRSIGTERGNLDAGDGLGRRASSTAGSVTVRFEGAGRLPPEVGRGDEIVLGPGEANETVGHVDARDGANALRLQQPVGVTLTAVPFVVRRAFHDIQTWESAREGNLVAEQRVEVGVVYDDGPFRCRAEPESGCLFEGSRVAAMATIDGSATDPDHYMALVAADGGRHRAVAGTGVLLDGEDGVRVGIRVRDHYARIAGLEMRGFGAGDDDGAAIAVERARHVLLEDLLIHHFGESTPAAAGVRAGALGDFTLRNSIIHDGGTGVRIDRPNATGEVANCTVLAMAGWGVREGSGLLNVRNTIAMVSGEGDFQVRRGRQDHNLSSDETAAGPGAVIRGVPARQFRSLADGARDLHLRADADAAGAGAVLYPAFATDIDEERRPGAGAEAWSMGADQ